MAKSNSTISRMKLSVKEKLNLLLPYFRKKILEQVKAVALIVVYLVIFQTVILGIAIAEALIISLGISVIVFGLAFFMEGLFLGLMPLGEAIGIKLPQKTKLPIILGFALILGIGVTFAEPAIGVLQMAGSFIKAWDAPLLFLMLNKHAGILKAVVGLGVGLAVVFGMLRFMFNWSLKPFLYIGIPAALLFSLWAQFDPNMSKVIGLAWDSGGVTTGPVTVPLVLALGIGVCRVVSKNSTESGGFGVVTLASLFPILAVLTLGLVFLPSVPTPSNQADFFAKDNRERVESLFESKQAMIGYALRNASVEAQTKLFDGDRVTALDYIRSLKINTTLREQTLASSDPKALERWAISNGDYEQRLVVFGSDQAIKQAVEAFSTKQIQQVDFADVSLRNGLASLQAILPLVAFLLLVLFFLLRERLQHPDEILLGVFFAVFGMFLFNIGIELGLSKLGNQVGSALPASFKRIDLNDQRQIIPNFDESVVLTAISANGEKTRFFYTNLNGAYVQVPYDQAKNDSDQRRYNFVPSKGPMFGAEGNAGGIMLVLLFAFIMGYAATLAEPALNALGSTVETLTVGSFKKNLLMQSVAIGVGVGILVGVLKIIYDIPLIWLIGPPYLLLLLLSKVSTEEFVNIGWDSAGVTTGPITVPLVLAMGLGLSSQVGAVEGFGILACASVFPILSVLSVGLIVNIKKKRTLKVAA